MFIRNEGPAIGFDDLVTVFETEIPTRHSAGRGDEYALVLIRHQGLLRDTYYLNVRPKNENDDVYSGKVGLFGGKIKKGSGNQPHEIQLLPRNAKCLKRLD